ncbi:MAG: DNA/RNA non-specific endonuclease, partial [Solirubrobacteraceae bacterium]
MTQGAFKDALIDNWVQDYTASTDGADIVTTTKGQYTYVFDVSQDRLIGVVGWSTPTDAPRPDSRMSGYPSYRTDQAQDDRGHMASHKAGGDVDINLVPQDHTLNISGEWRSNERYAADTPDTFTAVRVSYNDDSQRPSGFDQGIVKDGEYAQTYFENSPDFRDSLQSTDDIAGKMQDTEEQETSAQATSQPGTSQSDSDPLDGGLPSGGTGAREGASHGAGDLEQLAFETAEGVGGSLAAGAMDEVDGVLGGLLGIGVGATKLVARALGTDDEADPPKPDTPDAGAP